MRKIVKIISLALIILILDFFLLLNAVQAIEKLEIDSSIYAKYIVPEI